MKPHKQNSKVLVYWPSVDDDIKYFVNKCRICGKYRFKNIKEPDDYTESNSSSVWKIACDILDFSGLAHLVVIEDFSNWI